MSGSTSATSPTHSCASSNAAAACPVRASSGRSTEHGANRDRYGPARIDTLDQNGTLLATEHLADHITPFHATMLALERGLELDIDGG